MAIKLLILRHGLAGDSEEFKKHSTLPDSERPLTSEGKKELKKITRSIRRIAKKVDTILTSPYRRAQQTAQALAKVYPKSHMKKMLELTPDAAPEATLKALQKVTGAETLAIVGHEPHLSRFLNFILTQAPSSPFDIKKGGFALLEFQSKIDRDQAKLLCLIQPSQVKKIRKR